MTNYKLTLTDDDGVILERWNIGSIDDPKTDATYPLKNWGVGLLAREINIAIERHQQEGK
jgi:hypothetical protein